MNSNQDKVIASSLFSGAVAGAIVAGGILACSTPCCAASACCPSNTDNNNNNDNTTTVVTPPVVIPPFLYDACSFSMPAATTAEPGIPSTPTGVLTYRQTYANMVFVTPSGDDATGHRESITCPFATPWAAIDSLNANPNAAQAGDTVYIMPGVYINSDADDTLRPRLVKDLVKVWCLPGVDIQFTSFGNSVQPFFDNGITIRSEFRGFARVVSNYSVDRNRVLFDINSTLILEGDTFEHAVRFFNNNGTVYHFKARRDIITNSAHGHILAHRHIGPGPMDLKYHVDEAIGISNGTRWSQYDFRGFNENSKLDVWIGRLSMVDTSRVGVIYMENMRGHNKIHVDNLVQVGTPISGLNRPVLFFANTGGEYDIRIRGISNNTNVPNTGFLGNSIICLSPTQGGVPTLSNGTIELEGKIAININGAIDPTNLLFFAPNSRVTLILNLDVTGVAGIDRALFNIANVPPTVFITGRVFYNSPDSNSAPSRHVPFHFLVGAASPNTATFKDLTIQTNTRNFQVDVPAIQMNFIGTWSDKPLDPNITDVLATPASGTIGTFAQDLLIRA